jgi:hypothetical protein
MKSFSLWPDILTEGGEKKVTKRLTLVLMAIVNMPVEFKPSG